MGCGAAKVGLGGLDKGVGGVRFCSRSGAAGAVSNWICQRGAGAAWACQVGQCANTHRCKTTLISQTQAEGPDWERKGEAKVFNRMPELPVL